jgi:hypothetical protein
MELFYGYAAYTIWHFSASMDILWLVPHIKPS